MTHFELCRLAAQRFANEKSMALYEVTKLGVEKPDVLVFDSSAHTWLYEVKMTRDDFLADKFKKARKYPMFGDYRFFISCGDFIAPEEVPEGWGLYYFKGERFFKIKDSICFHKGKHGEDIYKHTVALLTNHIICEKKNIVFSQRVLENRVKYGRKEDKDE